MICLKSLAIFEQNSGQQAVTMFTLSC